MPDQEVYRDIPRIYTAIAESSSAVLYLFLLPRRIRKNAVTALVAGLFFCVDAAWLLITADAATEWWVPCMIAALLLVLGFLRISLRLDFQTTLYAALKAFLLAEFMASLEWQIEYFLRSTGAVSGHAGFWLVPVTYSAIFFIALTLEHHTGRDSAGYRAGPAELFSVALIVILTFTISNLSFVIRNSPFSGVAVRDIFTIRTMTDLTGLAIIYAYQSRVYEMAAERELSSLNTMLKAQYDRYKSYQDSINLINIKYHDLKHQLAGLRAEEDPDRRKEWIHTLEDELESYRPQTQTGNQVLDGILDQKMPFMRQNDIHFTCVADGKLLDFMHVTDICTIFGNAIDNAVEHVVLVEDREKRLVHMSIARYKQFISIEISNFCSQKIAFEDGFPVTSKADRKNHGFGTKSIAYTVSKYKGTVIFDAHHNQFTVKILIPLPQQKQ